GQSAGHAEPAGLAQSDLRRAEERPRLGAFERGALESHRAGNPRARRAKSGSPSPSRRSPPPARRKPGATDPEPAQAELSPVQNAKNAGGTLRRFSFSPLSAQSRAKRAYSPGALCRVPRLNPRLQPRSACGRAIRSSAFWAKTPATDSARIASSI